MSRAPRCCPELLLTPNQAGSPGSLVREDVELKKGGLCGHCSRDLPLDRRLLFVAELTGRKWWVVSVTLRRWSQRTSALQAARDLYAANNPKMVAGRGVAPRYGSL